MDTTHQRVISDQVCIQCINVCLLSDRGCAAIVQPVKPSKVIHVLYIKPAFGRFHLWWSYETEHSICITFQKVYCKPVGGDGFQNTSKHQFCLKQRLWKSICSWVVSQALTFKRDSAHYTQHRHFAAITFILCQHLSQTEPPWRILRIKTLLIFRWLV